MRIGHGYDVHRIAENRKLVIGGVIIPCEWGLSGHSDADVLIHAVCDALLGAAALGDIGRHFPDSDNTYKNIDSRILLRKTAALLCEKGYRIGNIDAVVIAQRPKLASYIPDMVKNISEDCKITHDSVNVKATTEEGLGFTGSGEGISAHAVCIIENTH